MDTPSEIIEPERKYRKQLNRNGWQVRLYRYVTGKEPRFIGYCPFFWLTLFYVFLSPFIFVWRAVKTLIEVLIELIPTTPEAPVEKVEKRAPEPKPSLLVEIYEEYGEHDDTYIRNILNRYSYHPDDKYSLFRLWIKQNPDWRNGYDAAKRIVVAQEEAQRLRNKRNARLLKYRDKIVNVCTPLVKPAIVLSAAVTAIYLYKWVIWAFFAIDWGYVGAKTLFFAGEIGVILGAIVVSALIFQGIKAGVAAWRAIPKTKEREEVKRPSFISKIGSFVSEACGFAVETVKMVYKKECPLIEWGEEEKPIERR